MPPASELLPEFELYRHTCDHLMAPSLVDRCERTFADLCASQTDTRILHADLHHYNVLYDAQHGWLAIDPQGTRAELEYEVGASLRNPIDAPEVMCDEQVIRRRLRTYSERLELDADRALRWAFSQAVLAALWPLYGDEGQAARAAFARAAIAMARLI